MPKRKPTIWEATKQLTKEYDVVTRDMIMDESGTKSKQHFNDVMRLYKKKGDIYSAKQGQYKMAEGI